MNTDTMAQRVADNFLKTAGLDPFRQKVYDTIKKHWPHATLTVKPSRNDTYVVFALWQKSDWPNGIFENDPAPHKLFIWGSHTPEGEVATTMEADLAMGGILWGFNAERLAKIGWRRTKGNEARVLKALDRYFGTKLKGLVNTHSDALEKKREMAKR